MKVATLPPDSPSAFASTRVSTMTTGIPARLALSIAGTISREPLGVTQRAATRAWMRFSTICICFSTSTSRSAACTTSSTFKRLAASSAPFCISMKKGLFAVFITRAIRRRPPPDCSAPRRHPAVRPRHEAASMSNTRTFFINFSPLISNLKFEISNSASARAPLQPHVDEHGRDDDRADDDLLDEGGDAEEVEAVAQHGHDERADERADDGALAAEQGGPADDGGGDGVQLVHHPRDGLRRVEPRRQEHRRQAA